MKKVLSLVLASMLVISALPTAYAADVTADIGTKVTVNGTQETEYTVTVPAALEAGGEAGNVVATGTWKSSETLIVTASNEIEVINQETGAKTKVPVAFEGINEPGNDLAAINISKPVRIEKGDVLFGSWTGIIEYTIEIVKDEKQVTPLVYNEKYILTGTDSEQDGSWMIFREDGTLEWYSTQVIEGSPNSGTNKYVCEGTTIKDYWGEGENDYLTYVISEDGKTIDCNPYKTWNDMVFIYTLESAM